MGEPLPISWRPEYSKRLLLFYERTVSCLRTFELELKYHLFLGLKPAHLWMVTIPLALLAVQLEG